MLSNQPFIPTQQLLKVNAAGLEGALFIHCDEEEQWIGRGAAKSRHSPLLTLCDKIFAKGFHILYLYLHL